MISDRTGVHKLVLLMKRKPGMDVAAFRDYYETRHMPLCMKYMTGAVRYLRRYLEPVQGMEEPAFDVITELWFEHRKPVDQIIATLKADAMPADVIADERNLFDRASTRFHAVIEHETELGTATS